MEMINVYDTAGEKVYRPRGNNIKHPRPYDGSIAGNQCVLKIKLPCSPVRDPESTTRLYLKRFKRRACLVHSVVLRTDWIHPLKHVKRTEQVF